MPPGRWRIIFDIRTRGGLSRSQMKPIRVLIIETHSKVRRALAARLRTSTAIEVVDATANADEGLEACTQLAPDVVLVDSKAARQAGRSPRTLLEALVQSKTNVIVLATYSDEDERSDLLHAGAQRYLLKDFQSEHLIDTILSLACGGADSRSDSSEPSPLAPKKPPR